MLRIADAESPMPRYDSSDPIIESGGGEMYRLALNAETLFVDRPFGERAAEIAGRGFLVDFWSPEHQGLAALANGGVRFGSFTGHLGGSLVRAEHVDEYIAGVRHALDVAASIGCRDLNLHTTGVDRFGVIMHPETVISGEMWITAYRTLMQVAKLGEEAGVTFHLENLNRRVDHPGAPLASVDEILTLVRAVDSPHLRLLLDLYHVQVDQGGLIDVIDRAKPWIGQIQVADVPGRHEPGTGEVNYPMVATRLKEIGYDGVIGLEAYPKAADDLAIERFTTAFA
jgi:hydroxypyruvate isomerase